MAGNAGGILKGGGGNTSGAPDTDEIVTRSPLSMVRTGTSLASKKPQWTVAGLASMRGTSTDLRTKISGLDLLRIRCAAYRHFVRTLGHIKAFHLVTGGSVGSGPKAGGGILRWDAASYAEAILRRTSSLPGSARNTSEYGSPGSGIDVGSLDGLEI